MTDLTPWLLGVVAALILAGGWLVAWTATHREEPTADIRWDDTDTMLLPFDDTAVIPVWVDGWGADGWCPLAELFRIKRQVAGPVPPLLFDALHAEWAPRLAIEPRRQLELEGAPA